MAVLNTTTRIKLKAYVRVDNKRPNEVTILPVSADWTWKITNGAIVFADTQGHSDRLGKINESGSRAELAYCKDVSSEGYELAHREHRNIPRVFPLHDQLCDLYEFEII